MKYDNRIEKRIASQASVVAKREYTAVYSFAGWVLLLCMRKLSALSERASKVERSKKPREYREEDKSNGERERVLSANDF